MNEETVDRIEQAPAPDEARAVVIPEILTWPDMRLREMSEAVDRSLEGAYVDELCQTLLATMRYHGAIGVSAIQIGHAARVAVIDYTSSKEGAEPAHLFLINPEIVEVSKRTHKVRTGCLSMPGVEANVETPVQIRFTVDHPALPGGRVAMQARGLVARNILHQLDLMDGVLFWQRLGAAQQRLLLHKYDYKQAQEVSKHILDAIDDKAQEEDQEI